MTHVNVYDQVRTNTGCQSFFFDFKEKNDLYKKKMIYIKKIFTSSNSPPIRCVGPVRESVTITIPLYLLNTDYMVLWLPLT